MERIISSDTMKTLMGEDFDKFVDFIFTTGNEKFRWKFEQTKSYDLELDIVKQPVINLTLAGVFSEVTRDRILSYGALSTTGAGLDPQYSYYHSTLNDAELVEGVISFCTFTGDRNIWTGGRGKFYMLGTCNHPAVTLVTPEEY